VRTMRNKAWWVDYLEGECESALLEEQQMLLKHSSTDRDVVRNLEATRAIVRLYGDESIPASSTYHKELQKKILARVTSTGAHDCTTPRDRTRGLSKGT
jgi:hypothetical protein